MQFESRGIAPSSARRRSGTPASTWLLLFAGWSVFGVVQALMRTVLLSGTDVALATLVLYSLTLAWMWAAVTPVVGWWTRAIRRRFASLSWRIVAHLPFVVIAALLHTALRRALVVALGGKVEVPFEVTLLYFADVAIGSYLGAVWAARAIDASARLTLRDRQTHVLRERLVAAQMEHLELQLRPHFLFNALSTIAELAHEAPKSAARMLGNVIALLESAVARHGRGLVPLAEELEAVRPYLAIQRLRFADWLVIEEEVDENARRAIVPQFILQPLVENAVHHGLIGRTEPGRVVIRARVAGGRLNIAVVDNGAGLNVASYHESRGIGLTNLRARLATVYGPNASLTLTSEPGAGTTALLDAPFTDVAPRRATDREREAAGVEYVTASAVEQTALQDQAPEVRSHNLVAWLRAHPVIAVCGLWTGVAMLRIQHSYVFMWLRDRYTAEAFQRAVAFDLAAAVLWVPLTPLVIKLGRLVPIRVHGIAFRVAMHVVFASVIAFAHTALTRIVAQDFRYPLLSSVSAEVYAWNVSIYAILLVVVHFQDLDRWIRERELSAARLRKELQEAQFQRVMLELRPGVLLDVLRRLVLVVEENAGRAEKILADIGEFLRATLDAIHDRDVPLRIEAAAVRAYARVLGVAYARNLSVQISIPTAVMDENVPNGILRAALDSMVGDSPAPNVVVHFEVTSNLAAMVVSATTNHRASHMPPRGEPAYLAEYEKQGLVEILERQHTRVAFRIGPRTGRNNGWTVPAKVPLGHTVQPLQHS